MVALTFRFLRARERRIGSHLRLNDPELCEDIGRMLDEDFEGRILPFDENAARALASISAARRRKGRPMSTLDAQSRLLRS
jgi:hypothetical protein